ncbi:MAG TPA: hypothetical protein VLR47_01290 [Rhodospirillales bacterium]|nr:hypothetical protein [Rhodospirillales bacterium]
MPKTLRRGKAFAFAGRSQPFGRAMVRRYRPRKAAAALTWRQ